MIVVDSSVVVDLLVRPNTIEALPQGLWHAPTLIDAEVVSGIRGHLLGGRLGDAEAHAALGELDSLRITRWPLEGPLRHRMLSLGHNLTAYDAAYVAVAEALDAPLYTRDRRLAAAVPAGLKCRVV